MAKIKLSSLNREDIGLYFNNSIVRVLGIFDKPTWCLFEGMNHHSTFIFKVNSKERKDFPSDQIRKHGIFHVMFPTGYANYRNTSVFLERKPLRSPTHGLITSNYSVETAETLLYNYGVMSGLTQAASTHFVSSILKENKFKFQPQSFQEVLEPIKYSTDVKKALDEVRRGAFFSRALSDNFALLPHGSKKGSTIFYRRFPIGECVIPGVVTTLVTQFEQELKDFFLPHGLSVKGTAS